MPVCGSTASSFSTGGDCFLIGLFRVMESFAESFLPAVLDHDVPSRPARWR
jgi:hypothetical protein